MADALRLRLPATSANLGPGFDALGLAMDFALHVHARESDRDSIVATGRNVAKVSDVEDSLLLATYRGVLADQGMDGVPLLLELHNEIPLGMGCGSSAAALVAGVALANHFGGLRWTTQEVLTEAAVREGHPDNVAACVLGGLAASAMVTREGEPVVVMAISTTPAVDWPLLLVLPESSFSTQKARALLPQSYAKVNAIANVQRVALLTAAFAQGRDDILAEAMRDTMHQPFRMEACPLLPLLLPLAGKGDVLGVALSGAGPSVLMILRVGAEVEQTEQLIRNLTGLATIETMRTRVGGPAILGDQPGERGAT